MNHFDPHAYGAGFAAVLDTDRRRPLDAGTADESARAALEGLTVDAAFGHAQTEFGPAEPVDYAMAKSCLSAAWLLHDFLDESHAISQTIDTPEGSFWHAIMHRREGDFSNSKYWFHRVGRHEVFEPLGQRAGELAATRGEGQSVSRLAAGGGWDPLAFVELCESVHHGSRPQVRDLCLDIQQAEWELLFDHCYQKAVGK